MADLTTTLLRKIEDLERRIKALERQEFAIMHTGDGIPAHNAVEGTLYFDYTNDILYINDNGTNGWTAV